MSNKQRQRIIETLTWMIQHFDFMNSQSELHTEDSVELKDAKLLLQELKNGN